MYVTGTGAGAGAGNETAAQKAKSEAVNDNHRNIFQNYRKRRLKIRKSDEYDLHKTANEVLLPYR